MSEFLTTKTEHLDIKVHDKNTGRVVADLLSAAEDAYQLAKSDFEFADALAELATEYATGGMFNEAWAEAARAKTHALSAENHKSTVQAHRLRVQSIIASGQVAGDEVIASNLASKRDAVASADAPKKISVSVIKPEVAAGEWALFAKSYMRIACTSRIDQIT